MPALPPAPKPAAVGGPLAQGGVTHTVAASVSLPDSRAEFEATLARWMAKSDWAQAWQLIEKAEPMLGGDARFQHQAGHVLMKLGHPQEAYARYSAALKLMPASVEIRLSIADAYLALQDRWSAAAWLSDALRVAPQRAATWTALAQLLAQADRRDEWLQLALAAVERGMADLPMTVHLADELVRRRDFASAARVYDGLLGSQSPACVDAPAPERARWYLHLGFCLEQLLALDECVAAYRQALKTQPGFVEAHINLAGVLWRLGDFQASLEHAEWATHAAPEHPHAWRIRGTALMHLNRLAEAEPWLRGALQRQPQFPYATLDLALLKLLSGAWLDGWALYRLRWQDVHRIPRPAFWRADLEWQGPVAQPVQGRTLLLYGEQGLGDMIQFARWARRLVDDGAMVYLVASAPLAELLQTMADTLADPSRLRVVRAGDEVRFDWHVAMLDLPHLYRIDPRADGPARAYLKADAKRLAFWRQRLRAATGPAGGGPVARLNVGLAWAGADRHPNNRNRSMPLSLLKPLWAHPHLRCHSLQKLPSPAFTDVSDSDLTAHGWQDLTPEWQDFADSAACIEALDLVITVDSAVAHLSAALGKPTWILLPPNPDWRWQLDGASDLWYESVRLFRRPHGLTSEAQWAPRRGQVAEVLAALELALQSEFQPALAARAAKGANLE
jgi:tetratricopeptide (TPR) repeat protein